MKKLFLLLFTLTFIWNVNAQKKAGFVGLASSVATIADDDEKAAATWFTNTYGGDYIPVADLGTADLTQYGVLWIHVDKQDGAGDAYDEIYAKATELNNYYKAGGNLLLSIHANNLLTEFGRVAEWPDLVAAGGGGLNVDVWSLNPVYGTYNNTVVTHNKATDPLYAGLTTEPVTRDNGNAYVVMPLIGNGWKEDHNCFWSMTIDGNVIGNGEEAKLNTWETTYNVDALGSWGQVQDYFGAAVARWKPQGDFKGTAITIGIGAYEWNINEGGPNPFQANIERLTKNALDELKAVKTDVKNAGKVILSQVYVNDNRLFIKDAVNTSTVTIFNVNGSQLINTKTDSSNGINISNLTSGVYIVKATDEKGNITVLSKFIK